MLSCNKKEEKIIQKSLELFGTYGIKSISMDDIATNLGMSKKTLYRFVKDKQDLISKVIAHSFGVNEQKIQVLLKPTLNAIEEVLALVRFFTDLHQSHSPNMIFDMQKFYPETYQVFREGRRKKLQLFYDNNFKKGLNEGLYRKNMDVNVVKKIIVQLSETIIESKTFTIEEVTSPHFIKEMYSYHLHGIVSEKGHKILEQELNTI